LTEAILKLEKSIMKKTLRSHARKARNPNQFFQSSAMRFNGMRLRDIPFALALSLAFGAVSSHAEPTGGAVAAGQAAISAIQMILRS
jgi:hypothetical protein